MDFGVSIFLIAVGAILTWAVTATVSGIDIQTVGVILMLVGVLGFLWSALYWGWSSSRGASRAVWYRPRYRTTTRYVDGPAATGYVDRGAARHDEIV